jgi:hypothetical protein
VDFDAIDSFHDTVRNLFHITNLIKIFDNC